MGVYYCIETVCLILSSLRLNLCVYAVLTIISPTWGMPGKSVLSAAQSSAGTPEIH